MRKSLHFLCPAAAFLVIAILSFSELGLAQTAGDLYNTDNIVGKMRYVPAGIFTQGSPTNEPGRGTDENQFSHFLTKNIAVMETAVTRQMWADLKLAQTSLPADPWDQAPMDNPVLCATWYHSIIFANLLSIQNGLTPCYYKDSRFTVLVDITNYKGGAFFCNFDANGYRLPTEGEREYLARAGTTSAFSINEPNYADGTCVVCSPGALPALESVSWFCGTNSPNGPKTAGSKSPNPWNLKDVHGNAMEWCWDYYGPYPTSNANDFRGPGSGEMRVIRGGAWPFTARMARSTNRFSRVPQFSRDPSIGFRLARTISPLVSSNVIVASPAGGETWWVGTVRPLTWTATDDINYVNIEYSTNNGVNWTLIAASIANSGQYDWSVPNAPSSSCLVRISNAANPATNDLCAANFSIIASAPPVLVLNRAEVDFYAASGQTSLPSQWLMISNSGGGTLNWSASASAGWVALTPSSGSGNQLIKIDANPLGMSPGTYVETITITDAQAGNSPRTIYAALNISSSTVEPYFTVELYNHQSSGGSYLRMSFIDFDGDGDKDIVFDEINGGLGYPHEPWRNSRIYAFRNDGQGNFTDATAEVFLGSNIVVGEAFLLVADFNGDGRDDLLVGDNAYDSSPFGGGAVLIFVQTADGHLRNEADLRLPEGLGSGLAVTGDIDGDGDIDIFSGRGDTLINDGSGYFTLDTSRFPPFPSDRPQVSCCFIDVDKDGDLDLFLGTIANLPRDLYDVVMLNDGTGHFVEAPANILPPRILGLGSGTLFCASSDFDGDGYQDLLLAVNIYGGAAGYQLLLNNGDGTFRDASSNIPPGLVGEIQTGDVNNDGWMDFMGGSVFLNQGNARFIEVGSSLLPFYDASGGGGFHPGDIDNDGDTDLFIFEGYSPYHRADVTFQVSRNIRPYVSATPLPYPNAPALVSPADGTTIGNNSPILAWNSVPTAISYELEVATDASFSYLIFLKNNICPTACKVTGLDNNTTYYWRVRAYNTRGAGAWSAVRSFFVSPITVVSPNGGENWPGGTTHNITWTSKGITGTVTIDLYKNDAFDSNIGQANASAGTYSWASLPGLAQGNNYKIKIYQGGVSDLSDSNFSTFQGRMINGFVMAYGVPLADVVLGGLPGNLKTDAWGFYTAPIPYGWSGTATPFRFAGGYLFEPDSRTYSNVTTNQNSDYFAYKGIPAKERAALIAFYNAANGDSWTDHSGWKTPPLEADGFAAYGSEGTWYGVIVSSHHVSQIVFQNQWLTGYLAPEIGNLHNLMVLWLNGLAGPIPASFANLTNLVALRLVGNGAGQLTGSIPPFIGTFSKLVNLDLGRNKLSGPIPPEIGNLVNMTGLWIYNNMLSGPVPASIKNLISLGPTALRIGGNALYTNDQSVRDFLNITDPGWEDDQTIAPTNVQAVAANGTTVTVSWTPILFTGLTGGYRVFDSQTSGGPYTFYDQTASKSVTSMQVTGLTPGTRYYFVVLTRTDPAPGLAQYNTVDSEYSAEVWVRTPGLAPRVDDIVADFGPVGLWLWSAGVWARLTGTDPPLPAANPDGMIAADTNGDNKDEIVVDFGPVGLWLWDDGVWTQMSGVNAGGMIATDTDGDGKDEVVGDFGAVGLWLWDGGTWSLLSGVNADGMASADVDGDSAAEVAADFGTVGLWIWNGGAWTQLSGVNADGMLRANVDSDSAEEVVVDFGGVGLWLYDSGAWSQLSGVDAQGMIAGDLDADNEDEVAVDFGSLGLWLWNNGAWLQVSGMNSEFLLAANATSSASAELIVDFGTLGIWMWDSGAWTEISTLNPESIISANLDADAQAEIVVDFGALGIYVWNGGAWSQLTGTNPESMIARKK